MPYFDDSGTPIGGVVCLDCIGDTHVCFECGSNCEHDGWCESCTERLVYNHTIEKTGDDFIRTGGVDSLAWVTVDG